MGACFFPKMAKAKLRPGVVDDEVLGLDARSAALAWDVLEENGYPPDDDSLLSGLAIGETKGLPLRCWLASLAFWKPSLVVLPPPGCEGRRRTLRPANTEQFRPPPESKPERPKRKRIRQCKAAWSHLLNWAHLSSSVCHAAMSLSLPAGLAVQSQALAKSKRELAALVIGKILAAKEVASPRGGPAAP